VAEKEAKGDNVHGRLQLRTNIRPLMAAALGACCGCLAALAPTLRKPPSAPVIAFIPRTTGTSFTEDMHHGADVAAQASGYQIYWNGPTREDDLDRQILIAEKAVDHGARALILGPTNVTGLTTTVNEFTARKVPVVFVQTEPAEPTGAFLSCVEPDQEEFGKTAAARAALVTQGRGEIAIVGVDRDTPETLSRADSFVRALTAYPAIRVVAETPGAVQLMEAEQSTRELIGSYPQLKAIFAVSAEATQGAMLALQEEEPQGRIALIGSDRDLFLEADLQAGKLDSLVTADSYQMGYLAVEAALKALKGEPLPPPQRVGVELLTKDGAKTAGNVDH